MSAPKRRLSWPWAADTPLDRARRLLWSYRGALADLAPDAARAIDEWALEHGQGWVTGQRWEFEVDDLFTIDEVADLAQVQRATVLRWHKRGLRYTSTPDGDRIRAGDLLDFERLRRQRRAGFHDTGSVR